MNEAMFWEMRSKAHARGMTVREYVKACGPLPECRGLYRNSEQCVSAYDTYKRNAFGRHYGLRPEDDHLKCVIVKGRQPGYRTMMVDIETNKPFADTGRDACEHMVKDFTALMNSTINTDAKAMAELVNMGATTGRISSTDPNLQSLPKAASNHIMNKTSIELRAELAAAEASEATAAEVAARQSKLDGYRKLAEATTLLLGRINERSTVPSRLLAEHRFELKALAAEFDFRIVLIGDRTQAVLVQQ